MARISPQSLSGSKSFRTYAKDPAESTNARRSSSLWDVGLPELDESVIEMAK
jgi:hypothetical protein